MSKSRLLSDTVPLVRAQVVEIEYSLGSNYATQIAEGEFTTFV